MKTVLDHLGELKAINVETLIDYKFNKIIAMHPSAEMSSIEFITAYLKHFFLVKLPPGDFSYAALKQSMDYLYQYSVWCVFNTETITVALNPGSTSEFNRRIFELATEVEHWLKIYKTEMQY